MNLYACIIGDAAPPAALPAAAALDTTSRAALLRAYTPGERCLATFPGDCRRLQASRRDLEVINSRHATDKLTEGDVEIFERFSANDQLMRRPLRFTKRALEKFARDFSDGRTVLLDHDESKPIGKTFAADVVKERVRGVEGNWLRTRFYTVTRGAGDARRQDIEDIRSGVRSFDSITLAGGSWEMQEVEGPDGETRYFFEIDDDPDAWPRLEAWELSLVYLGAVYGAGSEKGAGLRAALAADRPASDPWGKYTVSTPEPEPEPDPYEGRLAGVPPRKPEQQPESLAADPNDPYAGRLKR